MWVSKRDFKSLQEQVETLTRDLWDNYRTQASLYNELKDTIDARINEAVGDRTDNVDEIRGVIVDKEMENNYSKEELDEAYRDGFEDGRAQGQREAVWSQDEEE